MNYASKMSLITVKIRCKSTPLETPHFSLAGGYLTNDAA
jgi:hypothetical protein